MAMLMESDWPGFGSQPPEARPRLPLNLVQGGCGISGLYDLEPIHRCFLNDELKLNVEEAARNSPLHLAPVGQGRCYWRWAEMRGQNIYARARLWPRPGAAMASMSR